MMDAVEFMKTQKRMCDFFTLSDESLCMGCPFHGLVDIDSPCARWCFANPEKAVALVERWGKNHPVKTRQSEFLKQWPEALMTEDGLVNICPSRFVAGFRTEKGECTQYQTKGCDNCRRDFWLQEVE